MNQLAQESSPYLLQHKDNPVDWHPWNDAAIAQARAEGKPILLSIGYSACHWCHVMAHESFEDDATATLMNEQFINIKVDREERPDIDKIYQLSHQVLTQRGGGWPLTVFLSPDDLVPFFAGTYFPKEASYNMPSFSAVLERMATVFHRHNDEICAQKQQIKSAVTNIYGEFEVLSDVDPKVCERAFIDLQELFDSTHGGFGGAPKFPTPSTLQFLLDYGDVKAHDSATAMVCFTLDKMALGGIYDQIGGGFARYSVDERWEIPHFEKMLYDNALLLPCYATAWLKHGDSRFARVANETVQWMMREMHHELGGFYAALDADSEGEEGLFYVWDPEQVAAVILEGDVPVFNACFGLDGPPNFEGKWHLVVRNAPEKVSVEMDLDPYDTLGAIERARCELLYQREKRVRPGLDDKIITSWNGLVIRALAFSGQTFGRPDYIETAKATARFLQQHSWQDNRLRATWKNDIASHPAHLDDYAFLIDGLLQLCQASWDAELFNWACTLSDQLLDDFYDEERGTLFYTMAGDESLFARPRQTSDDVSPSGYAVGVRVLLQLGYLMGNSAWISAGEKSLTSAWHDASQHRTSHCALLSASLWMTADPQFVLVRGDEDELMGWQAQISRTFRPTTMCFYIPADATLPDVLSGKAPISRHTTAYVCTQSACLPAIDDVQLLIGELSKE